MSKRWPLALGFALLFALLAIAVKLGVATPYNTAVSAAVQSAYSPFWFAVARGVSHAGEWYVYAPVALLLVCVPHTRTKWGLPVTATLIVAVACNLLLKECFAVPRPAIRQLMSIGGYGFPSAHAMVSAAFGAVCCTLFAKSRMPKFLKILGIACLAAYPIVMGWSRIFLGVHTITDVLGGYAAGFTVALVMPAVFSKKCSF